MALQWSFRRLHPRWGAALSAASTTALVAALFFAGATASVPQPSPPGAALSLATPLPPPPDQPVFAVYSGGSQRLDAAAAGPMATTLIAGTIPPTPANARVIAELDCHVDAAGVEHCIHLVLLPDGSVLQVRHDHVAALDRCPEVGDGVTVERAGSG